MWTMRLALAACLCFVWLSLGCSSSSLTPANVSGRITYKGEPVKGGDMKFYTVDGHPYPAVLASDGTYSAPELPIGEMIVTVDTETINLNRHFEEPKGAKAKEEFAKRMKGKMGGQKAPPGAGPTPYEGYMKIPEKYADPKTSPLKCTLERGQNRFDFDLTD